MVEKSLFGERKMTDKMKNIFTENLEHEALCQFESAMELDYVVSGALMPDAHTGYTLPIGAVVATMGVILPSWIGFDIGCGMCALQTSFSYHDVVDYKEKIFNEIYRDVPVGFNHNSERQRWDYSQISMTEKMKEIFDRNGLKQLGTLGGGNHFIEIGCSDNQQVWIIIHSGSRGIGHAVATHYMKLASGDGKAREGHFGFDVNSQEGKDYITDMNFCLEFALENRKQIMARIYSVLERNSANPSRVDYPLINRNHNHAELKEGMWIHRKGATHAEKGMDGVIPGNMRDGSFIVKGKGNPASLWSSSHGAGRVMSRKKAKETINLDIFKEAMKGITAKVNEKTLDESPFAYKNIFEVMKLQKDFVEVVDHISPIINVKG